MLTRMYRFFKPRNMEEAARNKMYLAIAYGFLSWNCFIYMFYKIVTNQLPTDAVEQKTALINKLAHGRNIQHIRIEGLTIVDDGLINQEPPEAENKVEEDLQI